MSRSPSGSNINSPPMSKHGNEFSPLQSPVSTSHKRDAAQRAPGIASFDMSSAGFAEVGGGFIS